MRFSTTIELGGKTATGMAVPEEVVDALGGGRRPAVTVAVGGHVYRSTIAVMGGRFMLPLAAEHREAAGLAAGDTVNVDVELDTASRLVEPPADLAEAITADETARTTFDALAPSHRKEWVRWVEEAKKPETRALRIARTIEALHEGRRTR